eukprot:4653588-Alexandrium_andersonii.AAC.1
MDVDVAPSGRLSSPSSSAESAPIADGGLRSPLNLRFTAGAAWATRGVSCCVPACKIRSAGCVCRCPALMLAPLLLLLLSRS